MAMSSLNFTGLYPTVEQVQHIIYIAGVLDAILAVGIFLPGRWSTPFLIWALIWGLLTALSRVFGFMHFDPLVHAYAIVTTNHYAVAPCNNSISGT